MKKLKGLWSGKMDKSKVEEKKDKIRRLKSIRRFNIVYIIILLVMALVYPAQILIVMFIPLILSLYVEQVLLQEIRGV